MVAWCILLQCNGIDPCTLGNCHYIFACGSDSKGVISSKSDYKERWLKNRCSFYFNRLLDHGGIREEKMSQLKMKK